MNPLSALDQLIPRWADGDDETLSQILELSYTSKLLPMARGKLRRENKTGLLAEDLVHRVYELMAKMDKRPTDRNGFLAAFSRNMKWVLLDDHKTRTRQRRGGPDLDQVSISLADEVEA